MLKSIQNKNFKHFDQNIENTIFFLLTLYIDKKMFPTYLPNHKMHFPHHTELKYTSFKFYKNVVFFHQNPKLF